MGALPANGQAFVGLLVGGHEHIAAELKPDLFLEYGIDVRHHFSFAGDKQVPRDVEVILILSEFCQKSFQRQMAAAARSAGIKLAYIGRRKADWTRGLQSAGFVQKPSWLAPRPAAQGPRVEIKVPSPWRPAPPPAAGTNGTAHHVPPLVAAIQRSAAEAHAALAAIPVPKVPVPKTDVTVNVGGGFVGDAKQVERAIADAVRRAEPDTTARYVDLPSNKMGWPDSHMQVVVRLAESWKGDAEGFVERVWRETGAYRTPATLVHRLRALTSLLKLADAGLITGLERVSKRIARAKTEFRLAEKIALKRGEMPDWITADAATGLVGGIENRLHPIRFMYDRELGVRVCRSAEVLKYVREIEERGGDVHNMSGGYTALEWSERILERLKEQGPLSRRELINASKRGAEGLDSLLKEGRVLPMAFNGGTVLRLPGQEMPAPKPKPVPLPPPAVLHPEVPAPELKIEFLEDAAKKAPSGPAASFNAAARSRVIEGLANGSIPPALAADLLRKLEE
jgi:hypothetical protein